MSGFRWRRRSRNSCTIIRRLNCRKALVDVEGGDVKRGCGHVVTLEAGQSPRSQITKVGAYCSMKSRTQATQLAGQQHEPRKPG